MSIEQVVDPWGQWFPREQPADLREFDELVEEAEFEAELCGDVGFVGRVFTFRDPEADGLEEPDGPPPGWGSDQRWTPADPAQVLGRAGWLAACGRELNRDHARFLAARRAPTCVYLLTGTRWTAAKARRSRAPRRSSRGRSGRWTPIRRRACRRRRSSNPEVRTLASARAPLHRQ